MLHSQEYLGKVVNLSFKADDNIGDQFSAPSCFFEFPCVQDDACNWRNYLNTHAIIFGGGCLLNKIKRQNILSKTRALKIGWGLGYTNRFQSLHDTNLSVLKEFDLVGCRDFGFGNYVPCVSCMAEEFEQKFNISHDVVIYENAQFPMSITGFPKADNRNGELLEKLTFLGSGETIVTNSYHGAYWGILLGRKVVAIPTGSKFSYMKFAPVLTTLNDWKNAISKAVRHREALTDSRLLNENFKVKVFSMLGL